MSPVPPATANRRNAFVFVCQAGAIETKALLLAASLRRVLHGEYELIAAVPTPSAIWGELSTETREQLHELGVRIVPIVNPIDPDYPIGNKLACIDVATDASRIVFLDSDILCLRDFSDPACLRVPFAAKPADLRTFAGGTEAWAPLYAAAGVSVPTLALPTTVSGEFGLPYFNSGVIFVDAGLEFGRAWIDCANTIRATPTMREQRHWLDQVSLPIAVHRRGLAYSALDERYNFPAHLKPLAADLPFFCHYHWPRIVRREPVLLALVRELADAHPAIARVMTREPEWAELLGPLTPVPPAPRAPSRATPSSSSDIFLVGIPGSGAKELLQALEREGCPAIDEPAGLLEAIAADGSPTRFPKPGAGFVAIRCELAFLCRPDALRQALPQARIVACVRNPFDTIATWKARPHTVLETAVASAMESGRRWLAPEAFAHMERIAAVRDAAEQRAAWWWWLAQRLLERIDDLTIVRFEDGTSNRRAQARALLTHTELPRVGDVSTSSARAEGLDERDCQAIRAICMQAAAALGVADC